MNTSIQILSLACFFTVACAYSMEQKLVYDIMQVESDTQEQEKTTDSRLLLDLPQDVLRSIIRCAGEDASQGRKKLFYEDVPCIVTLFTQLRHVNKMLEQKLTVPDELKSILGFNQSRFDFCLNYYSCHEDKKKLGFIFFKSLIAMGADQANGLSNGNTCLHSISCDKSNDDLNHYLAKFYIKHGANVNQTNDEGKTPLHIAAFWDKADIAKVLLAHNAQLDVKDNRGNMPIDIVFKFNSLKVLNVLKDHGVDTSAQEEALNQINMIATSAKNIFGDLQIGYE